MKFYWRFPEQDGSWSPWYPCTAAEFRQYQNDPDTDTKTED
jgi:hypothetical protein